MDLSTLIIGICIGFLLKAFFDGVMKGIKNYLEKNKNINS
jgi:hypothetical protein